MFYVVSPLREADVRRVIEQMPRPSQSPYSALVTALEGRKKLPKPRRVRHTFAGIVEEPVEPLDAVLGRAQLQKPSRPPR